MSAERLRYGSSGVIGRLIPALLGAAVLALPMLASEEPSAVAGTTSAESANPINDQGSNYQYRSNITAVTPSVPGLSLQVLEFADRLLLRNHTGRTVTIYGYDGEPYARVLANGTAEENVRSPATYLNTSFYANVTVPPVADPSAPPQWQVIDRTGQFEWHDHRIHWMSPVPPAKVKGTSKKTLIFNWQVPIEVGSDRGAVDGQLFWTPENSSAPVAAIVLGAAILVGGLLFVLLVRRRRSRAAVAESGAAAAGGSDRSPKEAW
ncbi:MAG TPA: hypothetical protein VK252_05065 [Solirubrobacteraceae bacterium]|nr:hypothetical protein [Solirubrobacteraceae bacterium]